jgi:hypothetical protein
MLLDQNSKTLINTLNIIFKSSTSMSLSSLLRTIGNHKIQIFSALCTVAGCAIALKKPLIGGSTALAGILIFAGDYIYNSCFRRTSVEKLSKQYSSERDFSGTELDDMGEGRKNR